MEKKCPASSLVHSSRSSGSLFGIPLCSRPSPCMTPTRTSRAAMLHSRQEGCRCLQGQELRLRNLRRHLHRQGRCLAHLPHQSSLPGLRPRAERSDVPQSIPCRPRVRNCADVHKPIRTCCYTYQQVFAAVTNYLKATYGLVPDQKCKDISRACFLPHDPQAYINPKYVPFNAQR